MIDSIQLAVGGATVVTEGPPEGNNVKIGKFYKHNFVVGFRFDFFFGSYSILKIIIFANSPLLKPALSLTECEKVL